MKKVSIQRIQIDNESWIIQPITAKTLLTITCISLFLFIIACGGSYSKRCWENVCKITENGVVRYEGDPQKIKQLKAEDAAREAFLLQRQQATAQRQAELEALPKRQHGEIIRVAVLRPEGNQGLDKHSMVFYQWILAQLRKDKQLQVIPHERIRGAISAVKSTVPVARGWNESGPREKREFVPDAATFKKLREQGVEFDVLIYTSLSTKNQSGLVGGKGQGIGVISADRIEISGVASSIFSFTPHRHNVVGKSAGQVDIAGRDKDGEVKSATIKNKERNIKLDKPAAEAYAKYYASVIKSQIAPHLPSLQGLKEFESRRH